MNGPMVNLLALIRAGEAPLGYGQIFGGAKGVGDVRKIDVSKMKLNDVLNLQVEMLAGGSRSTACGGYQFLRGTLQECMAEMGISTDRVWTPELQDAMAVHLMERRQLKKYLAGTISAETFANNLAKEWASLPVVTSMDGAHRWVNAGETYYAGDKLNKASHTVAAVMAAVRALKTGTVVSIPLPPDTEPVPVPPQPLPASSWWTRLLRWLRLA